MPNLNPPFEVTLRVQGWSEPVLDLKCLFGLPVLTWSEYAATCRFSSQAGDSYGIATRAYFTLAKLSKKSRQIETNSVSESRFSTVFCQRTDSANQHLDSTHGYFNPAALCFFLPVLRATATRNRCATAARMAPPLLLATFSGQILLSLLRI